MSLSFTFNIWVKARNFNLHSILDANKSTRSNFKDSYQNVKIVLCSEKIAYVLDSPIPITPTEGQDEFDQFDWEAYKQHLEDNEQAFCILLASMFVKLKRQHEHVDASFISCICKSFTTSKGGLSASRPPRSCLAVRWLKAWWLDHMSSRWLGW